MKHLYKVAVLMGGPSSEHEVSLKTGNKIISALQRDKYEVAPITIRKDRMWVFPDGEVVVEERGMQKLKSDNVDIVFIAMHGEYGEDGTIQKLLEDAEIAFTGSNAKASALGMDKVRAGEIFEAGGLLIPKTVVLTRSEMGGIAHDLRYPIVVKPADGGSSVGITICNNNEEFLNGIGEAFRVSDTIMLQEFIKGREFTCGVIEDKEGKPFALPPTEIVPKKGLFFDYKSKYEIGGSEEVTPPRISLDYIKRIQEIAFRAHMLIHAEGISRTDIILTQNKEEQLYVLEINTIPGMTETSLLPQEAKVAGIEFCELLDRIIESGMRRKARVSFSS
ncbi:MAG: hypothetical protein A3A04_00500 [Candidatus Harrisonbacteria bacterium RIFCSPLOWO2_01_FULL_40_28]|uniref:D-alanine--D-alanine ligase n=1 Tax=Candidatus Harrisonbacteria bacterium RIFCSPLOWO2_01_FULL_40_28 TaxID=1798406 RepID=A0A1G1ZPT5_9BACT|nr:MAG: hypothetical protein A3A04_00500 [Candidatus Harrisonbacteria bacterium RIFCSPLOWO2_01_FULL_40_28]